MNIYDLAEKAVKELYPHGVELVYVDYDDRLTDEQVKLLADGDIDGFHANLFDWSNEAEREGIKFHTDDVFRHIEETTGLDLSGDSQLEDAIHDILRESDTQDVAMELAKKTPHRVSFMVPVIDEDHALWGADRTAASILDALSLEPTAENIGMAARLISESYSELGMCWINFDLSVSETYELALASMGAEFAEGVTFKVSTPLVCYGNPFTGAYDIEPLSGVERSYAVQDVMHDGSWGYPLCEIFGEPSDYGTRTTLIMDN